MEEVPSHQYRQLEYILVTTVLQVTISFQISDIAT